MQKTTDFFVSLFLFVKKILKRNRDNKEEHEKKVGHEDEKRETRRINGTEKDLRKNKLSFCALSTFLQDVYSRYGHL